MTAKKRILFDLIRMNSDGAIDDYMEAFGSKGGGSWLQTGVGREVQRTGYGDGTMEKPERYRLYYRL